VILMGTALLGVAVHAMSTHADKNSLDYQVGVAGVFVALLCVLFGILMLKTGLGTRLFTSSARPAVGGVGAGMSAGYGTGGGYDYGGGAGYY
jgi:hypothetical protein